MEGFNWASGPTSMQEGMLNAYPWRKYN